MGDQADVGRAYAFMGGIVETLPTHPAKSPPKVSVCVITYNHARYLETCLQSIVDQKTDFPFEIIVGEDCSTDGTQDILRDFAARYPDVIKPIFQPVNTGGTKNYLDVHAAACGDYVAHLDGDDIMLHGKLQLQSAEFDNDVDLSVCWHRMKQFSSFSSDIPSDDWDQRRFPNGTVTLSSALKLGSPGAHSSMMYRRKHWPQSFPELDIMDLFISWSLLECGNGKILFDNLGAYRVGNGLSKARAVENRRLICKYSSYFSIRHPEFHESIFLFCMRSFVFDFLMGFDSWRCFLRVAVNCFHPRFVFSLPKQIFLTFFPRLNSSP